MIDKPAVKKPSNTTDDASRGRKENPQSFNILIFSNLDI